jgi:hypothetical protein
MEEKAKAPFLKPALIYGAILGFIGILAAVVLYVLNVQFETWAQLISLAISIGVMIYCLRAYRDEYLGGFASYGKLVKITLGIAVIATVFSLVYTYVLIYMIDVDYVEKIKLFQIEKFSNNSKFNDAQLEVIIERIENKTTNGSLFRQTGIGGVIFTFIIGLIVSAFVKKEETPAGAA